MRRVANALPRIARSKSNTAVISINKRRVEHARLPWKKDSPFVPDRADSTMRSGCIYLNER